VTSALAVGFGDVFYRKVPTSWIEHESLLRMTLPHVCAAPGFGFVCDLAVLIIADFELQEART